MSLKLTSIVIQLVSIGVLLYAIYETSKMGLASLSARQVQPAFNIWKRERSVSPDEWQRVHELLLEAESLQPDNADYQLQLGQLYQYRWMTRNRNVDERQADLSNALDYYRSTVEKRAVWAYAWAHIYAAKSQLNELDVEFSHSLSQAVSLGPWEPPVQLMVSNAAFRHWFSLSKNDQLKVRQNTERGLKSVSGGQTKRMIKLIRSQEKYLVVCPYMKTDDLYKRTCVR